MGIRTLLAILLCSSVCRAQLVQDAYLKQFDTVDRYGNPSAAEESYFGGSVSINGRFAVIGAPNENNNDFPFHNTAGSAYVFRYDGTNWVADTTLRPESEDEGSYFGSSVSVVSNTIAISNDSRVFLYENIDNQWLRQTTFSGPGQSEWLGEWVALGKDRLAISVPGYSNDPEVSAGSVYVSERKNGFWSDLQEIVLTQDGPFIVTSNIAVDGETIAVSGRDRVSVFVKEENFWRLEASLRPFDSVPGVVAMSGNTLVISDYTATNGISCGVFDRKGTNWTRTAVLRPPYDNDYSGLVGSSVALNGDSIVIGSSFNVGSVFLFRRVNGRWIQFGPFGASNESGTDGFGAAVAISGERVIVGAPYETGAGMGVNPGPGSVPVNGAGAAYVFSFTQPITLTDVLLSSTALSLEFSGPASVSNWRILSGKEPDKINMDDSANFTITETAPGVYHASAVSGRAVTDREFFQIVKP